MKSKIIFLFITISFSAATKSYKNYKVYNVVPKTEDEAKFVESLQTQHGIEFWEENIAINQVSKVMVAPEKQNSYETQVKNKVTSALVIEDVQKLINDQLKPLNEDDPDETLFKKYHTIDEIYTWLDNLADLHPNIVSTVIIGQTIEGRNIKGVVMNFRGDKNNLTAIIEGGIHAREWISPSTVMFIINEFLNSDKEEIRNLADNFEWHIFPVVNPDGYSYTFTNTRLWRKNRNTAYFKSCDYLGVDDDMSNGVDLNRNYNINWLGVGASNDSCSNTFAGAGPASEYETRALTQYVDRININSKLIYYIAYHSYTQLFLIPYSHISSPDELGDINYADMFEIATRAANKAEERFGTHFRVGLSAEHMYAMSGTSFDYMKYAFDIPLCYLIELRDMGEHGFLLPPEQIIPVGMEIMDSLVEMDRTSRLLGYYSGGVTCKWSLLTLLLSYVFVRLFE